MSYKIIYDKFSVDMGDGLFMPVFLMGSNNNYECSLQGRGRRARNWWAGAWDGILCLTLDEWQAYCRNLLKEYGCESNQLCGRMSLEILGTNNTFKNFEGLFVASAKKSITFEKLVSEYGIVFYYRKGDERLMVKDKHEMLKLWNDGHRGGFNLLRDDDLAKRIRAKYYPVKKHEKELVEVDHYYVIEFESGYFVRLSRGGTLYSHCVSNATAFPTEKQAQAKVKYLKKKRDLNFKVVCVDEPTKLYTKTA